MTAGTFAPLPHRHGRLEYRHAGSGLVWGQEAWRISFGVDGLRVLSAHCELTFGGENVVRDNVQSVHPDFHPHDAFVRIMRDGRFTGSGWFRFSDTEAECESFTTEAGRIAQRYPIARPIRGFGMHALQSDAWMTGTFPYDRGAGHTQFFGTNLVHSTHHFGATGPMIVTTGSGLTYKGPETVETPAGRFDCHRLAFVGLTNDHPPYDLWVTRDGDFVYVRGIVGGYMDSVFELVELVDAKEQVA